MPFGLYSEGGGDGRSFKRNDRARYVRERSGDVCGVLTHAGMHVCAIHHRARCAYGMCAYVCTFVYVDMAARYAESPF